MYCILKPDNTPALTRKTAVKYAHSGWIVVKCDGGYTEFSDKISQQQWADHLAKKHSIDWLTEDDDECEFTDQFDQD